MSSLPQGDPDQEKPALPEDNGARDWDPRNYPATYLLLAINIGIFLWMKHSGVSATSPTPEDLLRFGAGSTPLEVLNQEWYRLVTAMFVHVGILHLAGNMWCLWNLGLLGEPLLGTFGLLATYVLTGAAGNLLSAGWDVFESLWYHRPLESFGVLAGASGAVFGISGLLIVLLSNRRLRAPWSELREMRRAVIIFAFLNLVIGAATMLPLSQMFPQINKFIPLDTVRIDNSAHLGGFGFGLLLGPGLVPQMTSGRVLYLARQRLVFGSAAFVLVLFGYWISNLR
ncbi:rhomboid protease GluP [Granulicella pectinivorans]|uniref:Rhomboid protease GluP n=1 Tax=Granulicella pectinivorans TaxID=474950 RepID=A0A1I6LZN8_9BACT|nr:rhomboid family intramembrane serine protease [Granulicella pectinivorans]SFS08848.1 rhomboid protease GluP [Granulicella pectinivorans]